MPICSVITCKFGSEDHDGDAEGIVFHRFPNDEEVRAKWVDMTGRDDWVPTAKDFVCSRHFRDNDYFIKRSGNRYLKTAAIPCEYVVYRHLFPDEEVASPNEAEVKVEVDEEEAGAHQEEEPEEVLITDQEVYEIPEVDQPGTSRGFEPLSVQTFGSPLDVPVFPDSTIYDNNDSEPSMALRWKRPQHNRFFDRMPSTIFDDNCQEVDSSGIDERYHREVRPLMNPYPPLDLGLHWHQLPPPKTPEPVVMIEPEPEIKEVPEPEIKKVPARESSSVVERQRGRQKLVDIKKIMTRRKSSKKAIAAALAEVREARKIQIQLQSGRMTDYDKAAAIIALQNRQIVKLTIKYRRLNKILKRISTVIRRKVDISFLLMRFSKDLFMPNR